MVKVLCFVVVRCPSVNAYFAWRHTSRPILISEGIINETWHKYSSHEWVWIVQFKRLLKSFLFGETTAHQRLFVYNAPCINWLTHSLPSMVWISGHSSSPPPPTIEISDTPLLLLYIKFTDRTVCKTATDIIPFVRNIICSACMHARLVSILIIRLSCLPAGVGHSRYCRIRRYPDERGLTTRVNALSSRPEAPPGSATITAFTPCHA